MSLKKIFRILLGIQFALGIGLAILTVSLFLNQEKLSQSQDVHFQSYLLADELRQSSDDLTRLARTYVATGNEKYEREYWAVLDIRNGKSPRPVDYNRIYWDFISGTGQKPRPDGATISLRELMIKEGFTNAELEKLTLSQKYSDGLVKTEKIAMNAVKGLFDDGAGNFTVKKEPDRALAIKLMNDEAYHKHKVSIMKPIDEFYAMFAERTAGDIAKYERRSMHLLLALGVLIIVIMAMFGYSFVIIQRQITKRERAEEALQASEERYRHIVETSLEGIWILNDERRTTFVNKRLADMLGYAPEEMLGKRADSFIFEEDLEDYRLKGDLHRKGMADVFERRFRRKDGITIWNIVSVSPLFDGQGRFTGLFAMFTDITERKRIEESLRSSEEEARRLAKENEVIAKIGRIINSSLNIDEVYERFAAEVRKLISIDRITINIVNPGDNTAFTAYASGTELLHRKKGFIYPLAFTFTEEVRRTRTSVLINEENYKDYLERFPGFAHNFQSGFRSLMVVPLISQDEVIGVLQFRSTKPNNYAENDLKLAERVGSQIAGAIANAQLFLERQQAEKALKESEAKYYDLYDNAPDMYYTVDSATGVIRECNETFNRKTGYSKEELIGHPIFEFYDEGSADDSKKSLQEFASTGEVHDAERRVVCKDGRIIDVSLNVSAIRDKDGKIMFSRAIWRDITERKKQEKTIRSLSITDQLTGLYNRRGFLTLAEQQLRVAERTKNGLLLLYADLDGLKKINDELGHKLGDEAIVEAANILQEVFRKMDIIARMGGDEFAVLASEASLEYAEMIKNRLQDQLGIHNSRAGQDYNLSLSIGMVYHDPATPTSLDEMISRADSLMYEQKRLKSL